MPISLEQFVQRLQDSGLFEAEELSSLRVQSTATDVEQFARELVKQKKLTTFQAQQVYSGKGQSLLLGNYVLLDKIGQGGMGLVFQAQHRRMKRIVALKVLSPSVTRNASLVARFQREVQAVARLEHPNIVAAFDADEAAGTSFLVMQYVDGQDLSTLVKKKGPLPLEQAVNCVLQTAQGLEYAHQQGIVHRDIKPANLLLDAEGTVKILDLGLARIEGGDTGGQAELTNTGAVMGTVDYMAPEQALSTKSADARSDIYSLGVALWYLLTGRPAFTGDSLMARMLAHREAPIPSLVEALHAQPPGTPVPKMLKSVDGVFRKMVAKKPADRYQAMTEVVAALDACLRGEAPATLLVASAASEDSKFGEFLAALANSDPSLPSVGVKVSAVAIPVFAELETQASTSPSAQTDPQTLSSPRIKPVRKALAQKPVWQDRRVQAAAAGVLVLGVLLAFLMRPRAPEVAAPTETIVATVAGVTKPSVPRSPTVTETTDTVDESMPAFFGNDSKPATAKSKTAGKWIDLFNGRDLTGWTPKGYNGWRVERGALVGETTSSPGWLMSDAEYTNFDLDLEFQLARDSNSGVFLRAWPDGAISGAEFVEVQLLDDESPSFKNIPPERRTGSIFNHAAADPPANASAETWHRLLVSLRKSQVRVKVDDAEVVNYNKLTPAGPQHIGLQLYPKRVEFRNIRLRPMQDQ